MSQTWISKSTRREQLKGNRSDQHQYIIKRNSLGPAFAVGKKTKNGVKWEKYRRAKRAQRRPGGGERTAEPGDMSLMPPFHDTRFWYHALIGQMSSCCQIRGAVDTIALFQCHAPTINVTLLLLMSRSYY